MSQIAEIVSGFIWTLRILAVIAGLVFVIGLTLIGSFVGALYLDWRGRR